MRAYKAESQKCCKDLFHIQWYLVENRWYNHTMNSHLTAHLYAITWALFCYTWFQLSSSFKFIKPVHYLDNCAIQMKWQLMLEKSFFFKLVIYSIGLPDRSIAET